MLGAGDGSAADGFCTKGSIIFLEDYGGDSQTRARGHAREEGHGCNASRVVYSREAPIKFFEGSTRVVLQLWAALQNLGPACGEATRPPTASAPWSQ